MHRKRTLLEARVRVLNRIWFVRNGTSQTEWKKGNPRKRTRKLSMTELPFLFLELSPGLTAGTLHAEKHSLAVPMVLSAMFFPRN
jgi:hypothetical protein